MLLAACTGLEVFDYCLWANYGLTMEDIVHFTVAELFAAVQLYGKNLKELFMVGEIMRHSGRV